MHSDGRSWFDVEEGHDEGRALIEAEPGRAMTWRVVLDERWEVVAEVLQMTERRPPVARTSSGAPCALILPSSMRKSLEPRTMASAGLWVT